MTPTSTPLTVLIAAHDPSQSSALAEMVRNLRPDLRVRRFQGGAEGGIDREIEIDVAMVVEPVGPRLGELSKQVRTNHPGASLVVIAPRFDEGAIEIAAGVGAAAIVASPCEAGTLLRVLKAQERKVRFVGRCDAVETSELLRLHAAAASNGILHLAVEGRSGAIHLEDGQPVHAHCGEQRGADAVHDLLRWTDARTTWIEGRSASARTIVGRIGGLLERELRVSANKQELEEAPRDVLAKLARLAETPDILAAYLMRNTEIVIGSIDPDLDEAIIGRALTRLSQVFHDMEDQQGDGAGSEIQATVGEHRLVVDRVGPSRLGFQVGVVVRQATPVCKSLRRLLRQIDRSFRKSLSSSGRRRSQGGGVGGGVGQGAREASSLHRVA